ncbi:MAG TPA: acyl-CoA thioesterase [Burkholderiaceae bacterium]|nr:acyl-CoA thioesterase [Burkholderiaceae bacterium]
MKIEIPASGLKLVHEMRIDVRWGDLDLMGHVNNTLYLRYFEMLRIDWLLQFDGLPNRTGVGPVMANGFCNYRRQIQFPEALVARHFVAPPGRTSLDTFFTLANAAEPDVVKADGGATLVWVDSPKGVSVRVPDEIRAACA